jgi:hypothetical protein
MLKTKKRMQKIVNQRIPIATTARKFLKLMIKNLIFPLHGRNEVQYLIKIAKEKYK